MARFVINYALASVILFCIVLIVYEKVSVLRHRVVTQVEYRKVTCVVATILALAFWIMGIVLLILVTRNV